MAWLKPCPPNLLASDRDTLTGLPVAMPCVAQVIVGAGLKPSSSPVRPSAAKAALDGGGHYGMAEAMPS